MKRPIFLALGLIHAAVLADAWQFSADDLSRRTIEPRAAEAVIWGMPAVNTDVMFQAMIGSAKGKTTRSSISRAFGRTRRSRRIPT